MYMTNIIECDKMLYNTRDLQTALGVGRDIAYRLMQNKNFPSLVIGGRYFISIKALQKWIDNNEGSRIKV